MLRKILCAATVCLLPSVGFSSPQVIATWNCVMNSPVATLQGVFQLNPDGTLLTEGEVILVGTNGSYRYPRIPGVWRLHPDQFGRGLQIVEMRFIPPGKTPLAIYPAVQQNPNYLYDLVPSSAVPGYNVETSCQRIG
ncbi:MAG: hypothetical protein AAFS07_00870 [Pseudomonadota bacterium]